MENPIEKFHKEILEHLIEFISQILETKSNEEQTRSTTIITLTDD